MDASKPHARTPLLFPLLFLSFFYATRAERVCVIGAGVAGSSFAYFLQQGSESFQDLHVFESSATVGGRLAQVKIAGHKFEAGASIIHDKNLYMKQFAISLGLETRKAPDGTFGIWNGKQFLFRQYPSQPGTWINYFQGWWDSLRLALRYGPLGLYRLNSFIEGTLSRWMMLYDEPIPAFESPEPQLESVGLLGYTAHTLLQLLTQQGIPKLLLEELVAMVTRVQYGQSPSMAGLAGAVALVGTGGSLWQVVDGNWRVPEGLLRLANATVHLESAVTSISKVEGGGYKLELFQARHPNSSSSFPCEVVVLAAPLPECKIQLSGVPSTHIPPGTLPYHHTHATFVRGCINQSYFGLGDLDPLPDMVGTVEDPSIPFSSISNLVTLDPSSSEAIFKIFSRQAMEDGLLDMIFSNRSTTVRFDWAAYPKYDTPYTFAPYILDNQHLYYINTFESAASAMETAAVGAKNVAKLVMERVLDQGSKLKSPAENSAKMKKEL